MPSGSATQSTSLGYHLGKCFGHITTSKGLFPGEHLVDQRPKRPHVSSLVDDLALNLFLGFPGPTRHRLCRCKTRTDHHPHLRRRSRE